MIGFRPVRFLPKAALFCAFLSAVPSWAQEPQPVLQPLPPPQPEMTVPSDGSGLMTLHAYSNLIQMPVLILSSGLRPLPPLKPATLAMRIDGGPWYRPSHVRTEGADPISLTIVLDFPGTAAELMPKITEAIGHIAPAGLMPHDHVSLFAMQCGLFDMLRDAPADPALLEPKMKEAIDRWNERSHNRHPPPCTEILHLWDTLAIATTRLSKLPGRRVIIVATDGIDRGSKNTAELVALNMQTHAVTAFTLRPEAQQGAQSPLGRGGGRRGGPAAQFGTGISQVTTSDPLDRLSEMSGGMSLPADRWNAGRQFAQIPPLLRGRYILEFPRPMNTSAGTHMIEVEVEKSVDFIRVSGTTVPAPDPRITGDPTTLPNDPTLPPQMGKPKKHPPQSF